MAGYAFFVVSIATLGVACNLPDADVGEIEDSESGAQSSSGGDDILTSGPTVGGESGAKGEGTEGENTTANEDDAGDSGEDTQGGDDVGDSGEDTEGEGTEGEGTEGGSSGTGDSAEDSLCCVGGLSWGWAGGLLPVDATYSISDCDGFSFSYDDNILDKVPPAVCDNQLACEGTGENAELGDIYEFLQSTPMQDVLDAGTEFYGTNGLFLDIPAMRITMGKVVMTIGFEDCEVASQFCTPIPPALTNLWEQLDSLAAAQPATDECSG